MNPSQLLRFVAIIAALAAGGLWYLTNGKIDSLQSQLGKAKSDVAAAKAAADKTVQDNSDKLTATQASVEDLQKKVKAALDEADLNKSRYDDANTSLDAATKAAADKDAKIATLSSQVADLSKKADSVNALNEQVGALTAENSDLKDKLNALTNKGSKSSTSNSTTTSTSTPAPAPVVVQLSAPFPAKVLAVDTTKWLLVLDVGTDNGVQNNAQLYLQVSGQALGVVQVTDSQAKMSTCSINSTGTLGPKDFANVVKKGLQVDCQKAL